MRTGLFGEGSDFCFFFRREFILLIEFTPSIFVLPDTAPAPVAASVSGVVGLVVERLEDF